MLGDSYAFCRYVNDKQTWEYLLQKKIRGNVLNYGVGNFGIDQAILKLKKIKKKNISKLIIINIVPETILRIHSFWKHYLEFGNYYAFKPKFTLKKNKLVLLKCPIKKNYKKNQIYEKIKYFKKKDIFYHKKFLSFKFSFPYTLKFLKRPFRNSKIICYVGLLKVSKLLKLEKTQLYFYEKAFGIIVNENIEMSHDMYENNKFTKLLEKLIHKVSIELKKRKKI